MLLNIDKPSILQVLRSIEIKSGSPFSTICSVVSDDEPVKISWQQNGKNIELNKGTDVSTTKMYSVLQIRQVRKEHAGNYSCVAENKVGKDIRTVNSLIILCKETLISMN